MIETLKLIFSINATYKINAFIYHVKRIPLLGKIVSSTWYAKEDIKKVILFFYYVFASIWEVLKKIIYVGLMLYLPTVWFKSGEAFVSIFLVLTVLGAFINTKILAPDSKKYYAVILMHMDAQRYVSSTFTFYLLKTILAFIPAFILFMLLAKVSLLWILPMLLFMVSIKMIGEAFDLRYYDKKGKAFSNLPILSTVLSIILLGLAYGLSYAKWNIPPFGFVLFLVISLLFLRKSMLYLYHYPKYRMAYQKLMTPNLIIFGAEEMTIKSRTEQVKIVEKDLTVSEKINSKKGFSYFNALFFARHRRILLRSAVKYALIYLSIFVLGLFFVIVNPAVRGQTQKLIMTWLPYMVFIMYLTNRGAVVTQAMFINCDHSMLSYNFYRERKTLLGVFKTRLKTLISINLIPALCIAIALPVLLYFSGGAPHFITYVSLFTAILFMSIFFSVHHLVLYYLLQPYDIHLSQKSSTYNILNSITYIACYFCMKIHVDTTIFSIGTIIATTLYVLLSLYLVYKYAPKTFKLK